MPARDAGLDVFGGLVARGDGVLTAEIRVLLYVVAGDVLDVGLGVTPLPGLAHGNLASPFHSSMVSRRGA
ncbi:MAG: hypothetical protein ABEI86_06635 [Halobacteriaceae archaeon]